TRTRVRNWANFGIIKLLDLMELITAPELVDLSENTETEVYVGKKKETTETIVTGLNMDRFFTGAEIRHNLYSLVKRGYIARIGLRDISKKCEETRLYYWINGDEKEVEKFIKTLKYHKETYGFEDRKKDGAKGRRLFCDITGIPEKAVKTAEKTLGGSEFLE
ncbi:MAG: hypothetical protein ABIF92_00845, partial [archaeon]